MFVRTIPAALLVALLLAVGLLASAGAASAATTLTPLEQSAFDGINAERRKVGCANLVIDDKIQAVARAHSADMRDRKYFSHTSPDGKTPGQRLTAAGVTWRGYAENIARGQQTGAAVVSAWMSSSGHRANILNCKYTRTGLGVATGTNGPWWTQDFVY